MLDTLKGAVTACIRKLLDYTRNDKPESPTNIMFLVTATVLLTLQVCAFFMKRPTVPYFLEMLGFASGLKIYKGYNERKGGVLSGTSQNIKEVNDGMGGGTKQDNES